MYDIEIIRKLILKLVLAQDEEILSICETCIHCPSGENKCKYNNIEQCNAGNVDFYTPNLKVIVKE